MNINSLNLKELRELQAQVAKAIATFQDRKRKEAAAALEETARQHGFNLAELMDSVTLARKRKPAQAKYANPANPSETWTGRGRKPRWAEAALASGKSMADLLI